MNGVLVSFEGIDGSGKSTQAALFADFVRSQGREEVLLREPGGTVIGEQIRRVLLDAANHDLLPLTELFLYLAARAQITGECIRPALDRCAVVILDRFIDSTAAYQGHARGLGIDHIDALNRIATDGLIPDLTIVVDCAPDVAVKRATHPPDRMEAEGLAFMAKVREGFLALCRLHPERIRCVDGSRPAEDVAAAVREIAAGLLR